MIGRSRMCRALMPGDEESMTDEAIWETLPVSLYVLFSPIYTSHPLMLIPEDNFHGQVIHKENFGDAWICNADRWKLPGVVSFLLIMWWQYGYHLTKEYVLITKGTFGCSISGLQSPWYFSWQPQCSPFSSSVVFSFASTLDLSWKDRNSGDVFSGRLMKCMFQLHWTEHMIPHLA